MADHRDLEARLEAALKRLRIQFVRPENRHDFDNNLDFFLPSLGVYVEVASMSHPTLHDSLSAGGADRQGVIVLIGPRAVDNFITLLQSAPKAEPETVTLTLPKDWRAYNAEQLKKAPQDVVRQGIDILREDLSRVGHVFQKHLHSRILSDPEWWVADHLRGGMACRNLLRQHGITDARAGCNLDDIYVGLIELAAMGDRFYQSHDYTPPLPGE